MKHRCQNCGKYTSPEAGGFVTVTPELWVEEGGVFKVSPEANFEVCCNLCCVVKWYAKEGHQKLSDWIAR